MKIPTTQSARPSDWATGAMLCTSVLAAAGFLTGHARLAVVALAGTVAFGIAARTLSRRSRGPMPHAFRWVLFLPRGTHSAAHLKRILEPKPGERILEVGPGIGYHSLPIAEALEPEGELQVLDAQPDMLSDLERRAGRAGVANIVATHGDAERLPYDDRSFDAAYLIGVLGEIPDPERALSELRRVLKETGRLIVGETMFDPDYVSPSVLVSTAERVGLVFERREGPRIAYFTRFLGGTCQRP